MKFHLSEFRSWGSTAAQTDVEIQCSLLGSFTKVFVFFNWHYMNFEKFLECKQAPRVPWNMTCKGAALTLIRGFAGLYLLGLPHARGFLQLFQAKSTGTSPGISCEVELFNILPRLLLPLTLDQCLLFPLHRDLSTSLPSHQP